MTISKQRIVALAQIAPVWLKRDLTINKILRR
ncbi:MAG: hypothetical protein ACI965_001787 [Paraglaciecola sp.]|jgi:hypothetical protein